MADTIKIGNLDISAFKVGSSDCKIYLGDTLLYPQSPTPTYEWVSYQQGDIVPRKTFYGVKLVLDLTDDYNLIFTDDSDNFIEFDYTQNDNDWIAYDLRGNPIDISEYYDESTYTYTIVFSDLGLGGSPLFHPSQDEGVNFEFDLELYEDPTEKVLQWVTYNNGDTIPSDLDIYGVSGKGIDIASSLAINDKCLFTPDRNRIDVNIMCNGHTCYGDNPYSNNILEYIFSNIGCCDSYKIGGTASGGGIQLYIYA